MDANDWLSVQVHPNDEYGMKHEGELGKTECWYIISAEEGSEIIYGHNAKSREELAEMINSGDWDHLLRKVKVKAGDFSMYLQEQCMQLVRVLLFWKRNNQATQLTVYMISIVRMTKAIFVNYTYNNQLMCFTYQDQTPENKVQVVKEENADLTTLVKSEFFDVYKWSIHGTQDFEATADYMLVSILEGKGQLTVADKTYALSKGDHFILPTGIEQWQLSGNMEIIASNPVAH